MTETGAAVRKGRACDIIWNAEVETERAKLLCRIKFKERGEGYPFELKMLISCKNNDLGISGGELGNGSPGTLSVGNY